MADAQTILTNGKQAQAIDSFREAWLHAQLVIKFVASEKKKNSFFAATTVLLAGGCVFVVKKKKIFKKHNKKIKI